MLLWLGCCHRRDGGDAATVTSVMLLGCDDYLSSRLPDGAVMLMCPAPVLQLPCHAAAVGAPVVYPVRYFLSVLSMDAEPCCESAFEPMTWCYVILGLVVVVLDPW